MQKYGIKNNVDNDNKEKEKEILKNEIVDNCDIIFNKKDLHMDDNSDCEDL